MRNISSEEKAAATIFEYSIVLPIVIVIIFALIFMGFILFQKAYIESSVLIGSQYMAKSLVDPNYSTNVSRNKKELSETLKIKEIVNKPYRFLFGDDTKAIQKEIDKFVNEDNYMMENSMMKKITMDDVVIDITVNKGIFPKVTVEAKQSYNIPLAFLKLATVEIEAQSVQYVNEPAEFIRNADYVIDIFKSLGITEKISEKINTVKSKVSFFFGKFGKEK